LEGVSDEELLLMYSEGDADAFDVLFDRYHRSVYNFARFMLDRAEGAADVMQETFLAVARSARQYKPRGHFRPWLMRIARNFCLNHLRDERARRRVIGNGGLDKVNTPARETPAPAKAESTERLVLLMQWIRELPQGQREALVLHAFEQMKYREISEALQVPLNTVKTLIHRARCTLAERLKEQ